MDRIDALIAIANLRVRLQLIERNPKLLEAIDMEIKRPIELAGLKGRLARAKRAEADIAVTGQRYDKALDKIDELHGVAKAHVAHLERHGDDLESLIGGMVTTGDNGGPNDGENEASASGAGGQVAGSASLIDQLIAPPKAAD
jgi:hypothetical protein